MQCRCSCKTPPKVSSAARHGLAHGPAVHLAARVRHPRLAARQRLDQRRQLRLDRHRVHAVRVQALEDRLGLPLEVGEGVVVDDNVRRRERLLLVEPPDVQLMDRDHAGDLAA
jgi:hypothetical protein